MIAKGLSYPEIVTKHNIQYLTQLVKNGTKIYPGANWVIKNTIGRDGEERKQLFNLKYVSNPIALQVGDIVERHLVTGDIVIFNRQPSLHKLSMMGHEVHVIEDPNILTFRMNVSVTDPYNAD
jgi:DNA-directed RNA polymerase II subunit RPB1